MKAFRLFALLIVGWLMVAPTVGPASAEDFYKGKTIRLIHGFGTGGGFDTAGRVVAKHLTKHVPGNPEFVVESMPGAASMIAMNYVYNRAKPDGLTMGFLSASLLVDEAMGSPGVQFDSTKFEWLGAPSGGTPVCHFAAASGIKNAEDWKKASTPPKIGATSPGAEVLYAMPRLLQTESDLPLQIIVGHKGGNPALKLAAERGEIAGFCSSLEAATIIWGDALKSGDVNIVVQFVDKPDPLIPNVPLAKDLVTTPDGATLIRVAITGPQKLNRVFAFPPGTPKEQVDIMRKALMETFKDPEFIADAKKVKVNVNAVDGEETNQIIQDIGKGSKQVGAKLKKILTGS